MRAEAEKKCYVSKVKKANIVASEIKMVNLVSYRGRGVGERRRNGKKGRGRQGANVGEGAGLLGTPNDSYHPVNHMNENGMMLKFSLQ